MERLHKFLSRAGVASRRAAEQMIVDGKVKVNGQVITTLGTRVDANKDLVVVAGKPVEISSQRKYFLFYKPPGVVTTLSDPQGRPTIADFTKIIGSRIFPVGRLDFDAEGALLLTDDGDLANKLMHPSHEVPRVYLAKVKGVPDAPSLEKLLAGVRLEDGMARATEASIFDKAEKNTWVKLVVTEGRQHLVKRLCAAIGHPVVRLFRPAHAGMPVSGLKPGELRELSWEEVKRVKLLTEGATFPEPPLALPARRHGHGVPGLNFSDDDDGAPVARPERKERSERPDRRERPARKPDHEARGARSSPDVASSKQRPGGKAYSGDRNPTFRGESTDGAQSFGRPSFRKDAGRGGGEGRAFGDRRPDRDGGGEGGEGRSFTERPEDDGGERPAFGERKPSRRVDGAFGDRRPAASTEGGDRPAFGDRKPPRRVDGAFGDRKRRVDGAFGDKKPSFRSEGRGGTPFGERKRSFGAPAGAAGDEGGKPAGRKPGGGKPFGGGKPGGRFGGPPARGGKGRAGSRGSGPKRDSGRGKPRGSW